MPQQWLLTGCAEYYHYLIESFGPRRQRTKEEPIRQKPRFCWNPAGFGSKLQ
jgi:hypothetical protein